MSENKLFLDLNTPLPSDIEMYKLSGEFDKAIGLIDKLLDSDLKDSSLINSLTLQREIIKRLPLDYELSFNDAFSMVKKEIPDFKEEELKRYMDEKRFSWIFRNHEPYIFNRFYGCLLKYEDFRCRLKDNVEVPIEETDRNKLVKRIKKEKYIEQKIKITHTIRVKDEFFKKGMNVTVHLPVPKACDHQKGIVIEKCSDNGVLSDENYTYRTICFKETMEENHPFFVTYSYTSFYNYKDLSLYKEEECDVKDYLNEKYPHIVFTDHLRSLCADIIKDCKNDLEMARAIYDYITFNMNYAFQPHYFVRNNIPEYTTTNFRGDCGFFALTFVTLCRIAGIPAYFESGTAVYADEVGGHDWARFYIKSLGWLYADPSYGIGSRMNHDEESRDYFFGNLDHERMVANSDYMPVFDVEKKFFSNDPTDNQLGEIETDERGLQSFEYEYSIVRENND